MCNKQVAKSNYISISLLASKQPSGVGNYKHFANAEEKKSPHAYKMARTWSEVGFDGMSLCDDTRTRYDGELDDFDIDMYSAPSSRSSDTATRGGSREQRTDFDVRQPVAHEPDAEQCYDEMVRYVKATTGMEANTARILPPQIDWEALMAKTFALDDCMSLLKAADHASLKSRKWYQLLMEVEGVLRPILLSQLNEPVYNHEVGCSLGQRGLQHAESKNFSVGDRVYTSNAFHMDDRFFVSIIVLDSVGSSRVGHIVAYFYIHADREKPAQ